MSGGERGTRPWGRWPFLVVGLALLGVGVVFVRRSGTGPKELDSSLLVKVRRADLAIDVVETGKVQPREKVEVKSKVAGQVERVFAKEGDQVKKGQLLLRLDPTDFKRDVARSEADVAQAKIALEFAQLNLERKRRGLEARGVAQADVDLAENEVKAKTVATKTAAVALQAAEDRLRYTQIISPMDGTVIQRGIEPGEVVTPGVQATFEGKPLLTVANLATLVVKADLNQIDVAKTRRGQRVTLTLDALPGRSYDAEVSSVAPASTTPKGKDIDVFPLEATLAKSDGLIRPGMTADVRVHIETRPHAVLLPIEAILKEHGRSWVTKVQIGPDGKQRTDKREVKLGARNDRDVEVLEGLAEGESVLIKPGSSASNEYKM